MLKYLASEELLVEENRGFSPSDIKDPGKKEYLTQLRKNEICISIII